MTLRKYLDYRLFGLIGAILMIISEFLPWISELTLFQIYIIMTFASLENSLLYLFPVICGIICLFATGLIIYDEDYKINAIIIYFIGLGFMLIFLFNLVPAELNYLANANIGFYICITGFLFVIINNINILMTKT
ncbi:MAG: hypothetical protein ACTSQP_10235 [Promethearchaeota archaeon]